MSDNKVFIYLQLLVQWGALGLEQCRRNYSELLRISVQSKVFTIYLG